MIVTKLMGGLGNQMFQYAAGKSLATKQSVPLFVDTTFLNAPTEEKYTQRTLELQQLKIELNIANEPILSKFSSSSLKKIFDLFRKHKQGEVFTESVHSFNPSFFQSGDHVYLNGFWQSELYFESIRELLLKEYSPNYELSTEEKSIVKHIHSVESIAIHVRRGDYVSNKEANKFHGLCDLSYYLSAITYIQKRTLEAVFFVFSDDIAWCRNNFKDLDNVVFVETKSAHASLDMFLMSYCKHNIIANSSYSWWAAWLNTNKTKTVIAPKKWFSDELFNPDIYAKNWIKL